ncbi:MAG: APC family permease [Solirubrobacterales bacterium]|nr:APC family permease [Solirubrobacterales bacterium]MBV9167098.1 APC family permease [Solirubrobacterales bacterium]MBV9535905.1 APC family permease [Solirubrobacterales bacterium]
MSTGVSAAQQAAEPVLEADRLDRGVGFLGLLWASEGSIIGSGWLFGALTAAAIAGPSAIIGWGLGSVIILLLALIHAELGPLFPVSGGTSRFPHYAFGSFAGATFGWMSYLQAATVAPIEVLAAIQYLSLASFAHGWYNSGKGTLSGTGIIAAVVLMAIFVAINLIGIRWLARVNNAATWWKVLIPILVIIVLMVSNFHSQNFGHAAGGFFPVKGDVVKPILLTLPAGIVFALLGFEQAVQLGGEAANPKRDLARAVIGSMILGAIIYILVQVAFIGAMKPSLLASQHGWLNMGATNTNPQVVNVNKGPFWTVATLAGIAWLATLLRIDAVVSPSGTGLIYLTSSSRLSFGLSKNGSVPSAFEKTDSRTRVPVFGLIVCAIIGLLFLLPFPSWAKLVGVVTDASVLMYAGAPLALGALRKTKADLPRIYRLPWAPVLAPLGFIAANLVVYWTGWQIYSTLMIAMLIGYALMALSYALHLNPNRPEIDWKAAWWIFPYLIGMGLISYFGQFPTPAGGILDGVGVFKTVLVGPNFDIPFYVDLAVVAAFSLAIYYAAIHLRLPERKVDKYVEEVYPPPVTE